MAKLDEVIGLLQKKYKEKNILESISALKLLDEPVIKTGSLTLDIKLGGGYPFGSIVEIYGPEASGKTSLALAAIGSLHADYPDHKAVFIDAEQALNKHYCDDFGIDPERLYSHQPDYGEQGFDVVEAAIDAEDVKLVVIDSVATMTPKAEIEGDFGEAKMGLHARLMSQALRKLVSKAKKSGTTLIFINQLRSKIGVVYGNPDVTTGGNALKYYASIRLEVRSPESSKLKNADDTILGQTMNVKVKKNKSLGTYGDKVTFDFIYGAGFDTYSEIIDLAADFKIIQKGGSWYSYNGSSLAQGRENLRDMLKDNQELYDEIYNKIQIYLKNEYNKS